MAGKKPTHDVTVPVNYTDKDGKEKTHWHTVGSAWTGENGAILFNICTMPGVKFVLIEKKDEEARRAA